MKNLTTPTAALIGVLAFGACTGSAFASTSTVDTLATAAAPAGAPAIAIGDPAASSTPVAGKVATFAGQTVPAGGVAINASQIAYDGGATILTLPTTGFTTQAASDCASGYLCLWQAENYGGRRLQFSSTGCHAMGDYGFNDEMTSCTTASTVSHACARTRVATVTTSPQTAVPDPPTWAAAGTTRSPPSASRSDGQGPRGRTPAGCVLEGPAADPSGRSSPTVIPIHGSGEHGPRGDPELGGFAGGPLHQTKRLT